MQITQRIPKFSIVIISLIFFWIADKAAIGIAEGKLKTVYIMTTLSALLMLPYVVGKIGLFPLLCGLVFMYWIPFSSGLDHLSPYLSNVYPTEFGMWMLCVGILIHKSVSRSAQWYSTLSRFPSLPFLLFIGGALITYSVSVHHGSYSLIRIRTFCFLPALICFLCIYLIKTVEQSERLLWIFLISAELLGLVYLYTPQITTTHTLYGLGLTVGQIGESGRLFKIIKLPLLGLLFMNPLHTSCYFAFIIALSFNLWLNHPSFWWRLVAASILAISVEVIIRGQGRGGLIAAGCSVIVITALTLIFRKHSSSLFSKSLLKTGIVILSLFGSVWYYASSSTIKYFQVRGMSLFTDPLHAHGLSHRIWRMRESLRVFFAHPFLGVGFQGFPKSLECWGSPSFAHNLYLYLLLSIGVIGFIGFFWIFLRHTKACWAGLHSDNATRQILCIGGLGIVPVLLVAGMFLPTMYDSWSVEMVWIPFGIIMAASTLKDEKGKG